MLDFRFLNRVFSAYGYELGHLLVKIYRSKVSAMFILLEHGHDGRVSPPVGPSFAHEIHGHQCCHVSSSCGCSLGNVNMSPDKMDE